MELEKYLTIFKHPKSIDEKQKKLLLEEFDFFYINYDLWYKQTIYIEESKSNKPFGYDDKLFAFLNQQEENIINLVKLKDYNLNGDLYFDFKGFWKDNYYRLSSKKLWQNINEIVKYVENNKNIKCRRKMEKDIEKQNKKIYLITGGAGYIGTNIISKLAKENVLMVVIDDNSNSHSCHLQGLIDKYPNKITFVRGNFGNIELMESLFKQYQFDAVVHLAAKKYIPESFKIPDIYERVNIDYTKQLLNLMEKHCIKKIVFPSSVSVYGNANHTPTSENEPLNPMSKYAESKICGERLIADWAKRTGYKYAILRLSNPIGANLIDNLGDHNTSAYSNLTTELFKALISNVQINLNGNNHPTKDGTAVRDFIHVEDVANAFVSALTYDVCGIYNIGYGGEGFSVLDIINELEKFSNKKLNYAFGPKREGDCSVFISDITLAHRDLNFNTQNNLQDMVKSSYEFFIKNVY